MLLSCGTFQDTVDPRLARYLIGLRHWRLGTMVSMEYEFLAGEIEGFWRQFMDEGLQKIRIMIDTIILV